LASAPPRSNYMLDKQYPKNNDVALGCVQSSAAEIECTLGVAVGLFLHLPICWTKLRSSWYSFGDSFTSLFRTLAVCSSDAFNVYGSDAPALIGDPHASPTGFCKNSR